MSRNTKYVQRLFEEWKQHKKIIIAVDFDDTIKNWKLEDFDTYDRVLDLLRKAQFLGCYTVVFTACDKERYSEIRLFYERHGINLDTINKNPVQLPYGNINKVYANIFLDDRAGLNEALDILEEVINLYDAFISI